jgi:hypothetical protein
MMKVISLRFIRNKIVEEELKKTNSKYIMPSKRTRTIKLTKRRTSSAHVRTTRKDRAREDHKTLGEQLFIQFLLLMKLCKGSNNVDISPDKEK